VRPAIGGEAGHEVGGQAVAAEFLARVVRLGFTELEVTTVNDSVASVAAPPLRNPNAAVAYGDR
jgi:hypothetical protein